MFIPPLPQLKLVTRRYWSQLHEVDGCFQQPEKFKDEVRTFGDLRRKETWKNATAFFMAKSVYLYVDDPVALVTSWLQPNQTWEREIWDDMIEQFLQLPKGLELVKSGLSQLYDNSYQPHSQEENNGLSRLVQTTARIGQLSARGTENRSNNGLLLESRAN